MGKKSNIRFDMIHERKIIAVFTYRTNVTAAHIFVSPGDAPAIITQYVAWMERQFNACQTPRSILPIYHGLYGSTSCCISQWPK